MDKRIENVVEQCSVGCQHWSKTGCIHAAIQEAAKVFAEIVAPRAIHSHTHEYVKRDCVLCTKAKELLRAAGLEE